jgi:outer membrane protein assembly factor BamB
MFLKAYSVVLILLLIPSTQASSADNWPQWRGPENTGVAASGNYPVEFSESKNLLWKLKLPGLGCSTPVVWGEQIFVTCGIEGQDGVVCYDFSGEELWRKQLGPERPGKHPNGSGSNPSPATDGNNLVVYYKSGTIACLGLDGELRWQTNLQQRFGADQLWWDLASSPVLAAGNAVVAVLDAGDCYVVALELASGEVAWKTDRTYQCNVESDQGYTTPSVVRFEGRELVVTAGSDHLTAHDAASGGLVFGCGGFNPDNERMWRMIASPVVTHEFAIVPYGRGELLTKVLLGGQGDVTATHREWEVRLSGSEVPTPVVDDNTAILLGDRGTVTAVNLADGTTRWSVDLPRSRSKYYASPLLVGDKLYCIREDGVVMVARVDDGLTLLAENPLSERITASPAALRDRLLIRGSEHLFLFGDGI